MACGKAMGMDDVHALRLAAFQPDMPQNVGAMLRLCACFGLGFDIIMPCGFVLEDARLKRVAMDYGGMLAPLLHRDWLAFQQYSRGRRVVLLTTKASQPYAEFAFASGDTLLVGQESAGVPAAIHDACSARVTIPLVTGARSLNVAMAAAIVAAEARRQMESQ